MPFSHTVCKDENASNKKTAPIEFPSSIGAVTPAETLLADSPLSSLSSNSHLFSGPLKLNLSEKLGRKIHSDLLLEFIIAREISFYKNFLNFLEQIFLFIFYRKKTSVLIKKEIHCCC